jgi:L-threonylcarbamoyladenylate synthase
VKTALRTTILPAGEAATAAAARVLSEGGLVAFPTGAFYGLGADPTNPAAVARIYQAKRRPFFNPLTSYVVGDLDQARRIGIFDAQAVTLATAFWPGPLTLVVPRTGDCAVAELATAGIETIAIRVPAHSVARAILKAFGRPVVAPSANLTGHVSPTTAAHVASDLSGRIDLIVDGGPVDVGESTVVGCIEGHVALLRPGGLPREDIERVLGRPLVQLFTPAKAALRTTILPASEAATREAARVLSEGGLAAFPTETVYGLGADATNAAAVARIYQAKGRPSFNPLISHVSNLDQARRIGVFNAQAVALANAFWPGPLTLVVPRTGDCAVSELATAGLETIAIRVPAHGIARAILKAFGGPVVAPSANLSGHVSPTTAAHVASDLSDRIDLIVDGGSVDVGVESTVIGCFGEPMLLRPGGVPREEIERVLGRPLLQPPHDAAGESAQPLAPGMLTSHYAPRTKVRLRATRVEPGEALLAFGSPALPGANDAAAVMNLSPRGDLAEAASHLFGYLRALDASGARTIAVMEIPNEGLGEAINDRLCRAAVGRN